MSPTHMLSTALFFAVTASSLSDHEHHLLSRRDESIKLRQVGGGDGTCQSVYGASYEPCGPENCYDPSFEVCCGDGSECIMSRYH